MSKLARASAIAAAVAIGSVSAAGGTDATSGRLRPFGSCGALVAYAKQHASQVVSRGVPPGVAAPVADGRAAGADFSTTNVQEAGVDEPDIVKTDGSHLFVVAAGTLSVVDARASRPRLLGSLRLEGTSQELLLFKRRLLVLARASVGIEPVPGGRAGIAPYVPTKTILSEIDVGDPASPRVVATLTVDGAYLTARLSGATARVVISSSPKLPPPEAVATSGARDWLPSSVLDDRRTGRKTTRALVQCRAVARPPRFSGLGLTTILTIDLDKGLPAVDSDAVMSDARTVYASTDRLYLATQRWFALPADRSEAPPAGITTEIHEFDTSVSDRTVYRATGTVPGFLLNQWSLSEYGGNLRVASTDLPVWWTASAQRDSESFVTVLGERGGTLVELGRVGGLGAGEPVYAVRFIGDVGFVVTFRQVDPLYTLDLGDPARPRVLGELELRGYSAYLHPVGADLLLGVGQDATDEGRIVGTQLTLFDVSNLRRPVRLDSAPLGPGSSEVEYDHHAFLYWPAKSLAVLPVQIMAKTPFTGAIAFRLAHRSIGDGARITLPGAVPVRRSVVVGSRLFSVSDSGVEASDLDSLSPVAWVPFG